MRIATSLRFALMLAAAFAISTFSSPKAEANGGPQPFGFGFQPFGFYQPYGARFGSSLRTPPYFSLSPPVYYGARFSRPYGLSPFAAPPNSSAPGNFQGRLRSQFVEPQVPTLGPNFRSVSTGNPFIHSRKGTVPANQFVQSGEIRSNPFVAAANPDTFVAQVPFSDGQAK